MQHRECVRVAVSEKNFLLFLHLFKVECESEHRVVDYFARVLISSPNQMRFTVLDVITAFDPFVVLTLSSETDPHSTGVQ